MEPTTEAMLEALLAMPIASLGTLHEGAPFVSMVPVVAAPDGSGFLIHVSRLAQHTRDLVADARMSLLFTAPLEENPDPLALPRVTLQGAAEAISADSGEYDSAAEAYLARFPQAELTLGLGDFSFFRLRPATGRLVLGFGRALSLDAAQIRAALSPAR
ncbi:pyridoxamine 5'-phosphate oxidase family protein [Geothrix sp.]|jgi:putative heme iron utilization protein|uniref:HugZ family pyridoxamine 5'-phosphate oxidase n=1 Tax=Geothrix sp. TaxID=1962974 RepID=UPI0025B7FD15|nr:pyridoxamine 5'-phosphate oxidase family protein [Geothrix sp.]